MVIDARELAPAYHEIEPAPARADTAPAIAAAADAQAEAPAPSAEPVRSREIAAAAPTGPAPRTQIAPVYSSGEPLIKPPVPDDPGVGDVEDEDETARRFHAL